MNVKPDVPEIKPVAPTGATQTSAEPLALLPAALRVAGEGLPLLFGGSLEMSHMTTAIMRADELRFGFVEVG